MTPNDVEKLDKLLLQFLDKLSDSFARHAGRRSPLIYVNDLLSDVQRKNAEAIALQQKVPPRTLQRFLESMVWDEQLLRDRCQQIVKTEHACPVAIGIIDETGTTKSGRETAGVKRQYDGNGGRIENCINNVALGYSTPTLICLLDARLSVGSVLVEDKH